MKSDFDILDILLRQYKLFNGNLLVAKQDKIIYTGSFGYTNGEKQNNLIDGNTIFELASVSKQFTAYSTLITFKKLNESIDNDIRNYLPDFPYEGLTARNLLNHTSGLPDYFKLLNLHWDKTKIATNKDVLELLIKEKPNPNFLPGENWEYSNTGYVLLPILLEIISGNTFSQILDEEIFKLLDMKNSLVLNRRWKPKEISNYAYGFVLNSKNHKFESPDNLTEYNSVIYMDGIQGDGTVNSTVFDLLKWNIEIIEAKRLDKFSVDLMLVNASISNNQKIDYGMGWMLNDAKEFGRVAYHGGYWPGYSTYNSIYLDKGFSIISLCNQPQNLETEQQIILALENITLDKSYELPNKG
jgi:CubicO group peptidase (beta-lactamase class C family)